MSNAVEFKGINKHFPGVRVLSNVTFSVREGEVHALLGENGAGKSTLLNILHGVYDEYEGEVYLHGKKVHFRNPHDAIVNGGISKVHQETNIVKYMTVAQNVALGHEPSKGIFVDQAKMHESINAILKQLRCRFRAEDTAANLSAGEMQMIAIAKALYHNSDIISLDEPTASLTNNEVDALFDIIKELKSRGITVIYVSHRLEEIFKICDRATILRDGECVATLDIDKTDRDEIIRHMVGRTVAARASRMKPRQVKDEVVLEVKDFCRDGVFENVNFKLKRGEILGFSGLVGAGRTEVMRALFGADSLTSGEVYRNGQQITVRSTQDALKNGIGLLPEERKTQGFIQYSSNINNMALAALKRFVHGAFVSEKEKLENCEHYITELAIHPPLADFPTKNMSGGNQQKVILAKWLTTDVDVLIFDEPTKGVDVAAKAEIYRLMEELVAEGKSIIVVSSELPEVMGISDRIYVMCEGRITAELLPDQFNEETLMNYAMGGNANA